MDKLALLKEVAAEVRLCTKCGLHAAGRINTVPGYGDPHAEIMFIGEAPGFHEDQQGLPFVGRSGQYLDELLAKISLKRDQVFIANIIKCRPPENRDPMPDEMTACHPYLKRQIEIINPLVIATLGRFSMGLFFPNGKITQIHGQPKYADGRAYYPFFHPAAVLRNAALQGDMERDMVRLPDVLAEAKRRRAALIPAPAPEPPPQSSEVPSPSDETPKQMRLF